MNFSMFSPSACSIQTIHIQFKSKEKMRQSKAGFNALLAAGDTWALRQIEGYPDGTVVKFFKKYVGGSPYVTTYGNIKKGKVA
jgi:hypothetical protein